MSPVTSKPQNPPEKGKNLHVPRVLGLIATTINFIGSLVRKNSGGQRGSEAPQSISFYVVIS